MIVVKVGGSLFDHPKLGPGLHAFLKTFDVPVLLVPGGGLVADTVRKLDRVHNLGEEAAHWVALRTLGVTAEFLERLLPNMEHVRLLDVVSFAIAEDQKPDALPHAWSVTSDSLALKAAIVFGASRLVLLKSVAFEFGTSWETAARQGIVDTFFPSLVPRATFPIDAIHFREWLERHEFGA
jgi:aspartokinase-like uncharacterized kinase